MRSHNLLKILCLFLVCLFIFPIIYPNHSQAVVDDYISSAKCSPRC